MLRTIALILLGVISITYGRAEAQSNYLSVAAVLDGELNFDSPQIADNSFGSGFILSYGHDLNENTAIEIAHARYADASADGVSALDTEMTAFEISGIFRAQGGAPFVRVGYSDGELKAPIIDLRTLTIVGHGNASESGPLFGVGFDIPIENSNSAIRLEYNFVDYDGDELTRLTIGTLVRF